MTKGLNNTISQSELEANTCNLRQARENAKVNVRILLELKTCLSFLPTRKEVVFLTSRHSRKKSWACCLVPRLLSVSHLCHVNPFRAGSPKQFHREGLGKSRTGTGKLNIQSRFQSLLYPRLSSRRVRHRFLEWILQTCTWHLMVFTQWQSWSTREQKPIC